MNRQDCTSSLGLELDFKFLLYLTSLFLALFLAKRVLKMGTNMTTGVERNSYFCSKKAQEEGPQRPRLARLFLCK